ncbi:hypothetical protein [Sphingomonas morindae]|uniref:Uncharacterized protein n=1 Tax=Sphingomonas morindae TaxID=1541170 RepID=A0ABY4X4A8_9SPHN|nr:hypothetical protein [Sphingomonas morindae]USI71736.1 hypothetical protein LHA26_10400 [Sphingomonas morindae]
MVENESERLLNEIGQSLMEDPDYPSEPTLLYTQLDHNMIRPAIFKELGNHFLYRSEMSDRLTYGLLDLWDAQNARDRWTELEFVLRDGRFHVTYFYPDEIDPEEDLGVRSERSLRRHFGDKPIVYPPLLLDGEAPRYDL